MVILHITFIKNNSFSGVCVVVPQHVEAQRQYATVGFLNVKNEEIDNLDSIVQYDANFDIKKLPAPFNNPDIIVFHDVYHPEYIKIARNLKKNHIPYIIVPHGCLTTGAQNKKKLKKLVANTLIFNQFIKNASALQCLSAGEMENTKFCVKKFIGTNGVSIPLKKKEQFSQQEKKLVYIGRLDAYVKGLDLMLEAIRLKLDYLKKNNCKFYIYGPDYQNRRENVKRLIEENGVESIVSLLDAVSGDEKEEILLNADIFLQVSRSEGMPLGILEALSYGLPCLITKGTNMGEYVELYDAGWVAESNAESIAEQLQRAIAEENKYIEKSKNAVRLIQEEFEWDTIAKSTIEQYGDIVVREVRH